MSQKNKKKQNSREQAPHSLDQSTYQTVSRSMIASSLQAQNFFWGFAG
jgi:hypothetical protein